MEGLILVRVVDKHGALWSVPADRIRRIKRLLGNHNSSYDIIVTDGDGEELLVTTSDGDPTTLGDSMYQLTPREIRRMKL